MTRNSALGTTHFIGALALLFVCASGCGSKAAPGGAGNDAGAGSGGNSGGAAGSGAGGTVGDTGGSTGAVGTGGSAGPGTGGAPGTCNNVVNAAPLLTTKISHPEPPPAMTGGTIADGTYFLTSMDKFNGTQGSSEKQETWVFANGTVNVATDKIHASGTFTTAGNIVTVELTCVYFDKSGANGGAQQLVGPYTATPTTLQKINSADVNEMHTFTKQ